MSDRVLFITGASSGIGKATARAAVEAGWRVALFARRAEALEGLVEEFGGVGTALVHALLGAAEARDEALVALLGEPGFYARFGFRPAGEHGIEAPDPAWGGYFRARAFTPGAPRGPFRYAAPFDEL